MKTQLLVVILSGLLLMTLSGCGGGAVSSSLSSGSSSGGSSGGSSGSSGGSSGDTGGTSTEITLTGTISINSTASALTVNSLKTQAATPAANYALLATDIATGSGTRSATSSSGAYELKLTTSQTYVFVLFDDSNRLQGVVTGTDFVDPAASGVVPQASSQKYVVGAVTVRKSGTGAITANGNGAAFWGKDSLSATVTATPLKPHVDYLVPVDKNGIPIARGGSDGNFGKGTETTAAVATSSNALDTDKDGIPDQQDADVDGNGIANSLDPDTGKILSNDRIDQIVMFSNVDAASGLSSSVVPDLVFEIRPKSSFMNKIDSVHVESGPAYINNMVLELDNPSLPPNDPAAPTGQREVSWKSVNYRIYRGGRDPDIAWMANVSPATGIKVGDTFVIKIAYTDSSRVDRFTLVIDEVFNSVPSLTKISGTVVDPSKTTQNVTAGQTVTLTIDRPKDGNGKEITGLLYEAHLTYVSTDQARSSSTNVNFPRAVGGTTTNAIPLKDSGSGALTMDLSFQAGDTILDSAGKSFAFRKDEITLEISASSARPGSHVLHSARTVFSVQ